MGMSLQEGTERSSGRKPVRLTQKGQKKVLADLEERCTNASSSLSPNKKVTPRAKPGKQHNPPVALSLFEDLESQLAADSFGFPTQGKKAEQ
jgi:hypothetical protein